MPLRRQLVVLLWLSPAHVALTLQVGVGWVWVEGEAPGSRRRCRKGGAGASAKSVEGPPRWGWGQLELGR